LTILVEVKGIQRFTRKGRRYCYHRATKTRIKSAEGTAGFLLEVEALDKKAAATKARAGTMATVIEAYKAAEAWKDLAKATQVSYERAFAVILTGFGNRKLVEVTPPFIAKYRDIVQRKRGRWMANYFLTTMSLLSDHAIENEWMKTNPVASIKRVKKDKSRPRANRPWLWTECRIVLEEAPPYLRVPIGLAMLAGFRKGDVLKIEHIAIERKTLMIKDHEVEVDFIVRKTNKRGVDVSFPIHPELARILAGAPKHSAKTVAANSYGESWTESGFNSTFRKLIKRLEDADKVKPGLTMHGLRHTVGTRLYEAGADLETIARLLGQQSQAMARHYSETADVSAAHAMLIGDMKVLEGRV
jgi:integrase